MFKKGKQHPHAELIPPKFSTKRKAGALLFQKGRGATLYPQFLTAHRCP